MRSEIILKKRPVEDKMDTFAEKSFLANIKIEQKTETGKSTALYLQIFGFGDAFRRLGFRIF